MFFPFIVFFCQFSYFHHAAHKILVMAPKYCDTTFFLFMGSMNGPLTLCLCFTKLYFDFQVYSFINDDHIGLCG